jgi:Spy/CpxP family protein refolding chaperone
MSEHNEKDDHNTGATAAGAAAASPKRRNWKPWLGGLALLSIGAVGGAMTTVGAGAYAYGGMSRMLHGHGAPAEIAERINYKMGWVLQKLDATPDQEERMQAIVARATESLLPRIRDHRSRKAELLTALTGETVDRAAVDELRRVHLQLAEEVSAELVDVAVEAADVLTPAQRAQLADHIKSHRSRHHGGHHGRHQGGFMNSSAAGGSHRL